MLLSQQSGHEGWTITTECREDKPDDWKPGDPIPYTAWGEATCMRPNHRDASWASTTKQTIAPAHFDDFNKAHREIREALITKIDSLKQNK